MRSAGKHPSLLTAQPVGPFGRAPASAGRGTAGREGELRSLTEGIDTGTPAGEAYVIISAWSRWCANGSADEARRRARTQGSLGRAASSATRKTSWPSTACRATKAVRGPRPHGVCGSVWTRCTGAFQAASRTRFPAGRRRGRAVKLAATQEAFLDDLRAARSASRRSTATSPCYAHGSRSRRQWARPNSRSGIPRRCGLGETTGRTLSARTGCGSPIWGAFSVGGGRGLAGRLAVKTAADSAAAGLGDLGDMPAGSVGAAVAEQEHVDGEELPGTSPAGAAQRFELVAFGLGQRDSRAGRGWSETFSDNVDPNIRLILCF